MTGRAGADDWGRPEPVDDIAGRIAIVGIGESEHTRASGRHSTDIAADAVERAIADAGLRPSDVDGLMWMGAMAGQLDSAGFASHFGVPAPSWTSKLGGGMVWAGTAPAEAARALLDGRATYVVNSFAVAWATERSEMVGGPGEVHAQERSKANFEVPFGWFPQPVYFATIARRHMIEYDTTPDHLGAIAVSARRHANGHPGAVMHDRPLTLEQYRAKPMLADPFRKDDCCLISDGGAAYVMTTVERARDLPGPVIEVGGLGLGSSFSGTHWAQQGDLTSTPHVFGAPGAFAMAGVSPGDVDVLTCYDPFTIVTLMTVEDMGFCAKGEGGPFVAAPGALDFDGGGLPTNTHGGMLSHAYVLGIAHVVEVVRQLRGTAANQVAGAEIGVYGGYTGPQASTLILRRSR